jgi:general nucleoside transport system permease protein
MTTAVASPPARPTQDFRAWMDQTRWARPLVFALVATAILSISRIIADAPDMTSGSTFAAAIGASAPILLAGLGGLYSERAGIVNIGLEGMMIMGTWFAGWAGYQWGPWAALVWGGIGGMLGGALHGLATVTFGVDHIVSGFAINIIAPGLCRYLSSVLFVGRADGTITQSPHMKGDIGTFTLPFLSGGSFFGWKTPDPLGWIDDQRWFFISDVAGLLKGFTTEMAWTTVVALLLIPFTVYLVWHTAFGLRLRSSGERPGAAYSLGVPVYRVRYAAVLISGFVAGLGGAWLAIDVKGYNQDQTAGRGYQGLAALIFGNYKPVGTFGGAGVFAYSQALTQRIGTAPVLALFVVAAIAFTLLGLRLCTKGQFLGGVVALAVAFLAAWYYTITDDVNNQLVFITPYVVVLIVLAFASQHLRPPAWDGRPWRKGME